MSSPNKHLTNGLQHQPFSYSTQSLTSLLQDPLDGNQHTKGNSYNSDPLHDLRQRNKDLERQSIALRSSSSNSLYRHGYSDSDGKHEHSTHTEIQTLQHSFEDLDRFQQQLDLKSTNGDNGRSISTHHSAPQQRPPISPLSPSRHKSDLSHHSRYSDHQTLHDTDRYYASLAPPYAECPMVTDNLHLPVPTILHRNFLYDEENDHPGDKQSVGANAFETMVSRLCPYPFRSRAPLGDRLKRKPPSVEQPDDDMDAAKRYPSLLAQQQREKRHSLGNGQIDRLVHASESLAEDTELPDLMFDRRQSILDSPIPFTSTTPSRGSPSSPPLQPQSQNDLLLEDRIHWLTQGYYLMPTSQQRASPSPPGGHDPPPSLLSYSPSSTSLA